MGGGQGDGGGPPDGIYFRTGAQGEITNFAVYNDQGIIQYRVDLTGAAHNGVETPHYQTYTTNTAPNGKVYPRETGDAFPGTGPEGGPPPGCE
jgi:hypothetical protein